MVGSRLRRVALAAAVLNVAVAASIGLHSGAAPPTRVETVGISDPPDFFIPPAPSLPPETTTTSTTLATRTSTHRQSSVTTTGSRDPFDRLASCESTGDLSGVRIDPTAYNASGPYLGAFQYDAATADEAGFQGDPRDYPYAEQKRITVAFARKVGTRRWPRCAPLVGL